jgi:hypothetical protein
MQQGQHKLGKYLARIFNLHRRANSCLLNQALKKRDILSFYIDYMAQYAILY